MTKKEAVKILIQHASNDFKGVGCGIRSLPSEKQKKEATEAFIILWKYAYGWELDDSVRHQLGL